MNNIRRGESSPLPFWEREGVRGSRVATTPLIRALHKGKANILPKQEKGSTTLYVVFAILIASLTAFLFFYNRPCANFDEATLQMPTQAISLAMMETQEKQARGLGGCGYIPKKSGMYFPFNPPQATVFWMKDMLIPIDIIWIKNGVVVGVEHNVLNETKDTPDSSLKTYPSPGEVDAVLEVAAGKAADYGLAEGVRVQLTK